MSEQPLLLLDIDGVVCHFFQDCPDWAWGEKFVSSQDSGRFPLVTSPEMGEAIRGIGASITWLTTWQEHAKEIGARFGWEDLPFIKAASVQHSTVPLDLVKTFWKALHVQSVCAEEGPPVIWIDDQAQDFILALGIETIDPRGRLLALSPDPTEGLRKEHLVRVREWLADRDQYRWP